MPTFALSKIDELDALPHIRFPVFKLVVNGRCEYDDWRAAIEAEGTYAAELRALDTSILLHAQLQPLPAGKYQELSGCGSVKDAEFRSKHLRVYLFKLPTGKVIVLGGNKKTQKQDIGRLRKLKNEYYATLPA